ncbi:Hin recombinase [Sphingomonas sp.]|uniref:Hin recombinase n=1 Tax=Sphingomonas sp. TaxID=28214 RepID=UPI0025DBCFE4|nr:Hin recombinase [Sphingomonas sp.]
MTTTIAFLAECQGSASIEEQKAALHANDQVVIAGRSSFGKLGELLARHGVRLARGDRIKVYDLSCIAVSTTTLVRTLTKLLRDGIGFEVIAAGIVIEPAGDDRLHALLDALDGHYRHVHGIKTHPADTAPQGRKRLLEPGQLPAIRAKLARPGATATDVAQELGVARSTLFNYLERYDRDRRVAGSKQKVGSHTETGGDEGHVSEREAS